MREGRLRDRNLVLSCVGTGFVIAHGDLPTKYKINALMSTIVLSPFISNKILERKSNRQLV